jgi:hypothetical protein
MPTTKLGDLAVKIGSYTKNGETKGRYETIGTLFQGDDGGQFITLKPFVDTWTLWQMQRMESKAAGKEMRDTLMVSVFSEEGRAAGPATGQAPARAPQNLDDDVPF